MAQNSMPKGGGIPLHDEPPYVDDDDDYNDDNMGNNIYGGSRWSGLEFRAWNAFRTFPAASGSLSEDTQQYMDFIVKVLKLVAYLLTFLGVLVGGVLSKCIILLMTSQLKPQKQVAVCARSYPDLLQSDRNYIATIPTHENVQWAWLLFFVFCIPELGTCFRSARLCIFKRVKKPNFKDVIVVTIFETLHTIGIGLLVFVVMPELDVVKSAMICNCMALVPGIFGLLSRTKKEHRFFGLVFGDLVAITCQISGYIVWPIVEYRKNNGSLSIFLIPLSLFLASFGWWENYVDKGSRFSLIKTLGRLKVRLFKTRYFLYMFVSIWKIIIIFVIMITAIGAKISNFKAMFEFSAAFGSHAINITRRHTSINADVIPDLGIAAPLEEVHKIFSNTSFPVYMFFLAALCSHVAYITGKFACKIHIQGFSYGFPVNMTVPVCVSVLIAACGLRYENACEFDFLPPYIFWDCRTEHYIFYRSINNDYSWLWFLWLLSQTWITYHIWTVNCERLASTEKLFVTPMYNGLVVDQSLALNRRRDDDGEINTEEVNLNADEHELGEQPTPYYETISNHTDSSNANNGLRSGKSADNITKIFACATMWHETADEMKEMLKSIFRMDEDQSARRISQKYLEIIDQDYYEFETHIFFDDAFEISDDNEDEHVVNKFVHHLVENVDLAASHVHQTNIRIRPPKKVPTPYGGRLVWILPGKTKIVCHLKDKDKIRHKKRWSQVMYMYYLLGYKLMDQPISIDRKEVIASKTFLLTLDGDIDFAPKAVILLVDLMKKNPNLGAACGRIHPVGSGIMVWYQMFEYAIGHWLQKATEHMIGCVLCSPGCFSLFRGMALMDDDVMAKYATKSSQARHYVQYDQGEDRWLCTLLLQRGYRVEYSAASDAYTNAPEGFSEFYNQRRRWVPSTMANIMDLLGNYKRTVKINDNISAPYIFYQSMLMGGTILGPGTIFLMLVGAFVAAFKIGNWPSFQYNIYPILIFMFICFALESKYQIIIAQIMSASYALTMMAVIVGTTLQIGEDGVGSPSAIFMISLSGSFFIAACMHPQEFKCIIPGMLYLLAIPSMYLLLIIYSLVNLNNVSWGTREVATKKTKKEQELERKAMEEAAKKKKQEGLFGFLYNKDNDEDEGSINFSCAGLFKIMCCVKPVADDRVHVAHALDAIRSSIDDIKSQLDGNHGHRRRSSAHPRYSIRSDGNMSEFNEDGNDADGSSSISDPPINQKQRDDLMSPYWMEDKNLKKGEVEFMSGQELSFWQEIIELYLKPLDKNPTVQKEMENSLKELRNLSFFMFSMLNAIFIIIVFLLQLNKDKIHLNWPLGVKTNITKIEGTDQFVVEKTYLQLEPIGLVFVFFFALIVVIQFVAMLFHRFGTISHILASTDLMCCCKKKNEELNEQAYVEKRAIDIVKEMQRLGDHGNRIGLEDDEIGKRRPLHEIEKQRNRAPAIGTLDVAFRKRFLHMAEQDSAQEGIGGTPILGDVNRRKQTITMIAERSRNMQQEEMTKKSSKIVTLGRQQQPRARTSIASDADNERVFSPNGSHYNDAFDASSEIYRDIAHKITGRSSRLD